MRHVLTGLIKCVVVDDSTYENCNMIYHNGMNKKTIKFISIADNLLYFINIA